MQFIWILPVLGAALGGYQLLIVHDSAQSAPQQAAGAAMACAYAVVPYVIARSIQAISDAGTAATQTKLLASIANTLASEE